MKKISPHFVTIGDLVFDHTITPKGSMTSFAGSAYNVAVVSSTIANPKQ
ncbi:MAG TPA: hypothetical protein VJC10_02050 [Patescibacteria group bacterium]|nr:hypothetical protein [Patescibacteria group bacterium]